MKRAVLIAMCLGAGGVHEAGRSPPRRRRPRSPDSIPASFDREVRPQDDLFRHVNGSWLAKTEIPADKASYGAFDILFDKAQADLRAIVEEAAKSTDQDAGFRSAEDRRLLRQLHERAARRSSSASRRSRRSSTPSTRIKTKTDLARHFARFFKLNLINPIVGYVDGDAQQPTNDILYVFQGGLGLPDRDYYLKNDDKLKEYREKYVGFVGNILGQAGDANAEQVGARDLRARDAAGARALDQRREPRRGEDLQQGRGRRSREAVSRLRLGRRGRRSSASAACPRSSSISQAT